MVTERLKKCDLFGTTVKFTYKGDDVYRTKCGSFVSVVAVVGYLTLVSFKLIEFFGETDPIHYMAVLK